MNPPTRVRHAEIALCAAWVVSALGLFVNQVVFHGSGIGPGPALGIVSLLVQAAVIFFIHRGSGTARAIAVAFFALALLPLQLVPRLIAEREVFSASYTVLGFVLKGIAVWLLFSGDSPTWFGASR